MLELPRIISVDDHLVEPPNLWQDRLPARFAERGPRVERHFGRLDFNGGKPTFVDEDDHSAPGARWCDHWVYDDLRWPFPLGFAAIGPLRGQGDATLPITFDDMLPGCFQQAPRLADMDLNHVEASLCFPTFPRFCGQTFLERQDKELALLCVQAYNDFMIDEWCAGAGYGRLIPMTIVPLWDADLAAAEVRRCAEKGSHAIAFSEVPPYLGLPSIHSGYWDPMFAACQETETVVNMHIGSGSKLTTTSADAPLMVIVALQVQSTQCCLVDWLSSGVLSRFPTLKIVLSEGQVGWMPYTIERMDNIWDRAEDYEAGMHARIPNRPSSYFQEGRIFGCVFDDLHGLESRATIGMQNIMFEVDYPHADSAFPHSKQTAEKLIAGAGLNEHEAWQLVRGNAIKCYDLGRYGITE